LEAERLKVEQKAERLETERLEAEKKAKRLEKELKAERKEAERSEAERKEAERLEAEQKEARRMEVQRKVAHLAERMAERLETERKETEKREQVKSKAPKPIEPSQTEQPAASAEEGNKPSDSGCKHYFGYLSQRKKGEGIPESCLGCPRSLDCMLSDYYNSKEPIEEIKKWYPDKT
jgi:hypothetical protein